MKEPNTPRELFAWTMGVLGTVVIIAVVTVLTIKLCVALWYAS